jgi:hypothetical protein
MRLSIERIAALRLILQGFNLDYTDQELQGVGIAVIRFAFAKYQHSLKISNKEGVNHGK